ncbi:MAG TPA: FAD-dependent oxidoreductase [Gemmataceae bacterium]|jgi:FADH2 O2-dependent halogenase
MLIREEGDLLILGAGFAGALMALTARQVGLRPILVEKGRHPRFAIGESSTPIANLVLEDLARTYDLRRLLPLCKYGRWQAAYPHLACGLKRGFTFVRHEAGRPFTPTPDHANELLVAASPRDEIGDTHWFREHFDDFVVKEAVAAGIPYYDQTEVVALEHEDGWCIRANRLGHELHVSASFLIDATGPSGLVPRALGIDTSPAMVRTNAWSVFSHFTGVELWQNVLMDQGGRIDDHPYRCDHAALHHILEDGWIWVLRFNNGVTSAGVMYDGARRPPDTSRAPEEEWGALLRRYPSVGRQFAQARPVQPWVRSGRVQRKVRRAAGDDWAMLAHAAYFLDPLFSSGNAHSLLTIERLTRIFARHWGRSSLKTELAEYEAALLREVDFVDRLVHGCYRSFGNFDLLAAFTMYYFAGAIHSEERRRAGLAGERDEFLFSHHPPFREAFRRGYERLLEAVKPVSGISAAEYERQVARDIAPYNTAGLCDPGKRNMYPFA